MKKGNEEINVFEGFKGISSDKIKQVMSGTIINDLIETN